MYFLDFPNFPDYLDLIDYIDLFIFYSDFFCCCVFVQGHATYNLLI